MISSIFNGLKQDLYRSFNWLEVLTIPIRKIPREELESLSKPVL